MRYRQTPNVAATLATLVLVSACSTQQDVLEAEFGTAVRSVMNNQIHDYDAAVNPEPDALEGSDPNRLNKVLTTYREHVTEPEAVRQPIEIAIGQGN